MVQFDQILSFSPRKTTWTFTKKSYLLFQSMISSWFTVVCCNIVTLIGWQDISLGISRNMIQFGWNCTWALACLILMMVLAQTHFTNTKGNMKSESCIEEKSGAGLWWWRSEPGSESFFQKQKVDSFDATVSARKFWFPTHKRRLLWWHHCYFNSILPCGYHG